MSRTCTEDFFPLCADARLPNEASSLTGVAVALPWGRHKMYELVAAFPRHPVPWRPAALTPPRLKLSAQKRVARSASPCQRLSLVLWEKVKCRECRDGWCEERLLDARLSLSLTWRIPCNFLQLRWQLTLSPWIVSLLPVPYQSPIILILSCEKILLKTNINHIYYHINNGWRENLDFCIFSKAPYSISIQCRYWKQNIT